MLIFIAAGVSLVVWVAIAADGARQRAEWVNPPYPMFTDAPLPEPGDLGVLRVVLDGAARAEIGAALAEVKSMADAVRVVAKVLLARRDAWRSAGAIDVDTCRLFDVPFRYSPLLAAEREKLEVLDDWQAPPDLGPFRSAQSDSREVVVVVIVLGIRESPVLRAVDMDTLVTVGEIGRGDTVAAALETFAVLGDRLIVGEVLTRNVHAGDLFRAYSGTELVKIKP